MVGSRILPTPNYFVCPTLAATSATTTTLMVQISRRQWHASRRIPITLTWIRAVRARLSRRQTPMALAVALEALEAMEEMDAVDAVDAMAWTRWHGRDGPALPWRHSWRHVTSRNVTYFSEVISMSLKRAHEVERKEYIFCLEFSTAARSHFSVPPFTMR
mmetsp:Transcript_102612/g.293918  ORF Transcript_102612/g.293918 Transcript_102612/m.293918 type:complete len:160 (+) Transcript_102612:192-671(+)